MKLALALRRRTSKTIQNPGRLVRALTLGGPCVQAPHFSGLEAAAPGL